MQRRGGQVVNVAHGRGHFVDVGTGHAGTLEMHAPLAHHTPDAGHQFAGPGTRQGETLVGGHRVQGRSEAARQRIVEDARALEEAGAFSIVLEGIPLETAREVTEAVAVPTIGIGAGPHCDGQVLVLADLLGLTDRFAPRFIKRYETFADRTRVAVGAFVDEVRRGAFPAAEHAFSVAELEDQERPRRIASA